MANIIRLNGKDLKDAVAQHMAQDIRIPYGQNLFNPYSLEKNKDLGTNGVAVDSQSYDITDYINVTGLSQVTFKLFDYTTGGNTSFTFYQYSAADASSFIKRTGNSSYLDGRTFNLESGTNYLRIRLEHNGENYINPYQVMLVAGEATITDFVPFYTANDRAARASNADLGARAIVNRLNTGITDADTITDVGYYYLSANIASNLPETSGAWWLWNTKLNANNMLQLAYEAHGYRAYMRAKVAGTWGTWEQIATGDAIQSRVNKLADTSSISLFQTVGCCGDSFTAGYLYNKPESIWYDPNYAPTGAYPKISYGKVMGRLYGLDVTLYAKGGLTTTAWRTDSAGLPALRADAPKDLYIICLGLNDCTNNNVPLGVPADLDTEPETPTWYGNMGVIIRSIQDHAPMSRIVLLKSPWVYRTVGGSVDSHYTYNSAAIEYIKEHLGIPYLETLGDPFFCGAEYIEGVEAHGLHPTAPLYAGMGRRIGELVGQCIIDNPAYFYNFYIPNN